MKREYSNKWYNDDNIMKIVARYSHSNRDFYKNFWRNTTYEDIQHYLAGILRFDIRLTDSDAKSSFRRVNLIDAKCCSRNTSNNKQFSIVNRHNHEIMSYSAIFKKKDYEKYVNPTKWRKKNTEDCKGILKQIHENKTSENIFYKLFKNDSHFEECFQNFIDTTRALGSTLKSDNNTITFDIDAVKDVTPKESLARNELFLKDIMKDFNIAPNNILLKEINHYKGSMHVFIKLSNFIENHKEISKQLESYIRENFADRIDVEFHSKILRFPFSAEYLPYNPITNKCFNTFKEALNYTDSVAELDIENFYCLDLPKKQTKTKESIEQPMSTCRQLMTICHQPKEETIKLIPAGMWRSSSYRLAKNKTPKQNIRITEGHRFELVKKIVPYCVFHGYSFDETVDYIMNHTDSSKDINKYKKAGVERSIKGYYDKLSKECPTKIITTYNSNISLLDAKILKFIDYYSSILCFRFKNYYEQKTNRTMGNKKFNYFLKVFPELLKEIFGQVIYDTINPKTIESANAIISGTTQISEKQIELILSKYVNQNKTTKNDIHHMKNILLEALKLVTPKRDNQKSASTHIYGYCKNIIVNDLAVHNVETVFEDIIKHLLMQCMFLNTFLQKNILIYIGCEKLFEEVKQEYIIRYGYNKSDGGGSKLWTEKTQ